MAASGGGGAGIFVHVYGFVLGKCMEIIRKYLHLGKRNEETDSEWNRCEKRGCRIVFPISVDFSRTWFLSFCWLLCLTDVVFLLSHLDMYLSCMLLRFSSIRKIMFLFLKNNFFDTLKIMEKGS